MHSDQTGQVGAVGGSWIRQVVHDLACLSCLCCADVVLCCSRYAYGVLKLHEPVVCVSILVA